MNLVLNQILSLNSLQPDRIEQGFVASNVSLVFSSCICSLVNGPLFQPGHKISDFYVSVSVMFVAVHMF